MSATVEISETLESIFQRRNISFTLPPNKENKFKDLNDFISFIDKEVQFWSPLGNEISKGYQQLQQYLNEAVRNQHLNNNLAENNLTSALNMFHPNQWPYILSALSESKRCLELAKTNPQQAQAYIDFFKNNTVYLSNPTKDYITGVIDFVISKHAKDILRRASDSEKKALADIRDNFIDDRMNLAKELEQIRAKHKQINDTTIAEYATFKTGIENWKADIQKSHKKSETEIQELLAKKEAELSGVTERYEEYMSLAWPATYWNEMMETYRIQGMKWIIATVVSSIVFIGFLTCLLYNIPSWITVANSKSLIENIKVTVFFGLIISMFAYLIRLFVRLAVSAHHLSRDAKERFQLTRVYLSLLERKAMTDADRGIVLQALFSRADTGLLKGDTSPTMPDSNLASLVLNK